ncbi:MAG: putative zinc-binding metallopeptidase [Fimbriimonadales bacterium]
MRYLVMALLASPLVSDVPPTPMLLALEKRYGIAIDYPTAPPFDWGSVTFENLIEEDSSELRKYAFILASEFNKYPKTFVAKVGLRRIALVKNMALDKVEIAASPDYKKDVLYLDIFGGKSTEAYRRHVIHHEFYHMAEEQLNGDAFFKDPEWAALNEPDFIYGKGGISARGRNETVLNNPRKGFIDAFSMSGLEEDKAEIYAALFVADEHKRIMKMAEDDSIILSKVNLMKQALQKWCPELNEAFWQKVRK